MKSIAVFFILITVSFLYSNNNVYGAFLIRHSNAGITLSATCTNNTLGDPAIRRRPHNRATTAVILGTIGIITSPIGVVCSIIAVLKGAKEITGTNSGRATAGLILGIIGIMLFIIAMLFIIFNIIPLQPFLL
jgi:hypothetical protein